MRRVHAFLGLGVVVLALVPLCVPLLAGEGADMRRPKKLIETGWDKQDTEALRQNLEVMEKRPFDGVVFEALGRVDEKKRCNMRYAFANEEWKREWFQSCVDDVKACRFKRFTDNFVIVNANPGNVDWFDDAGWKAVVEHWRIAAWLARETKIKGILFDPEPYRPPYSQFSYNAQPERDKHSFEDYYAKARERGREVMRAIVGEYPNITLFCYFMNSVNGSATGGADPRPMLCGHGYGLYPPFIDGWLDVAPPTMTFVDGCESAYLFNSVSQYLEAAVQIKGACQDFVSPENRAKYRAQVQVSCGIYLDAYWNAKDSELGRWYIDGLGGPRVDRLRANVGTALRVADEYVWVYGEKFRWWPTTRKGVREQDWREALPGSEDALAFARDPVEYARGKMAELQKEGKAVNLARNGDFGSDKAQSNEGAALDGRGKAEAAPPGSRRPEDSRRGSLAPLNWKQGGAPAGWNTWQLKVSKGVFSWDRENGCAGKGAAKAAGVTDGCFIQTYTVKPCERYVVQAVRRLQGRGDAKIRVRWQTAEGKWTLETMDRIILTPAAHNEWGELLGVVEVPEGAGKLVLLLGVTGQPSPEDAAWYDDVRVYKIE